MGLFDKLSGGPDEGPLNKQEAFAAVMLAVSAADGNVSDEEVEDVVGRFTRMRLFSDMGTSQLTAMTGRLFRLLKKGGSEELIRRGAPVLPHDLRETAFAVAVDMAFSDGSVEEEEKRLIERLQQELGLADELAMQVVNVMIIKNRG